MTQQNRFTSQERKVVVKMLCDGLLEKSGNRWSYAMNRVSGHSNLHDVEVVKVHANSQGFPTETVKRARVEYVPEGGTAQFFPTDEDLEAVQ